MYNIGFWTSWVEYMSLKLLVSQVWNLSKISQTIFQVLNPEVKAYPKILNLIESYHHDQNYSLFFQNDYAEE